MANFTITIRNTLNLFGQSPASLWNRYNWGAFKWGEGTATMIWSMDHLISESLSPTDALTRFEFEHFISETLTPLSEMIFESVEDGSGYNYLFPSNTIDSEQRARASYTTVNPNLTTWSTASVGSTNWS